MSQRTHSLPVTQVNNITTRGPPRFNLCVCHTRMRGETTTQSGCVSRAESGSSVGSLWEINCREASKTSNSHDLWLSSGLFLEESCLSHCFRSAMPACEFLDNPQLIWSSVELCSPCFLPFGHWGVCWSGTVVESLVKLCVWNSYLTAALFRSSSSYLTNLGNF